ncbi:MAG TPA: TPM domain-containing protein [Candidatus Binatia bacterium]|nr:TPM domain-containing protein [Candidatus Binatia bacterium]
MTHEQRRELTRAVTAAENGTTGVIAVRVIPDASVDAFERAKREFAHVGLHRHKHANAALILVAPKARRFAIVGDRALHERVGDEFWNGLVEESRPYFARGEIVDGIRHAVERLGEAFRAHFPEPAR